MKNYNLSKIHLKILPVLAALIAFVFADCTEIITIVPEKIR